jgi:SPOR domain
MADDHTQRPTRSSQPPLRPGSPSGNDPLAELARLIGQNDPFAEYGRDAVRGAPAAAPPAYEEEHHAAPPTQAAPFPPAAAPPSYAQPGYDEATYAPADAYAQTSGYEQGPYYPNNPSSEAEEEPFYDDVPPRRRLGILAIAAVFALAVIGTAGAFGYRALFGSSGHRGPPPVIKADATPSKIVPAASSTDPKSPKLIYDRVANGGQNDKLVSREEQPVDIKDKPTSTMQPQTQNGAPGMVIQPQDALGSGVVGVEPKRVHTIDIRPDQMAAAAPDVAHAAPSAPMAPTEVKPAMPAQPASPPRAAVEPAPHHTVVRAEPPRHVAEAARHVEAPSNAPLSLNPNADEPPAQTAQRNMRTAAVTTPTSIAPTRTAGMTRTAPTPASVAPMAGGGGYAVQIVARHNEEDAQASFHSLQAKFPHQLGGHAPLIRRIDLGAKGVYYRAMIGPFSSAEKASELCSSLKAAGGQCIVQKI